MAVFPGRWGIFRLVNWRRQFGVGRVIALALTVALLGVRAADPEFLQTARARTFDLFQQIKPQPSYGMAGPVAIVDIDEDSLAAIGQWPWPRSIIAQMIANLGKAGAVVVGFDAMFPETDRMSPGAVANELPGLDDATKAKLSALPSNESIMAQAMSQVPVVLGMAGLPDAPRRTDRIPNVPTIASIGGDATPWLQHFVSVLRNTPDLDFAAAGWGMINPNPEPDGVVRRVPALVTDGTNLYPALSMDMLRIATANQSLAVRVNQFGVTGVIVRPALVPTDNFGRIWVYAARHDPTLYIPAKDIIQGDPQALAKVRGKMILVGTSASGLQDIRHTAVEGAIPGVEVHAQIIDTVIHGMELANPPNAGSVEWIAMLVGALLMIVLVPIVGARWTIVVLGVVVAGAVGFSWYEFDRNLLLYDPVMPSVTTLVMFLVMTISSYINEENQKRQVRAAFGRYLSPAMVARVAGDPSALKLGGEKRDMTLLFCDVRGFTTISEQFDAEGLTKLINKFLSPMTEIILARKGTIDKYMGDCIMAFWNAPLDDPDHAANAIRSALAMNARLGPLNDQLEQESKAENRRHVPIRIGIGLNSGPVVVGNMGCDLRMDYSCLGDTVNTASRLEGQSKGYGVLIVLGENTYSRAPGFAFLELDVIQVKGKTEGVRIYTVVGDQDVAQTPEFKALAEQHDAMLSAYRSQDWRACRNLIARCRELCGPWDIDHYYEIMLERVEEFEHEGPGVNWDGVYVAKTK